MGARVVLSGPRTLMPLDFVNDGLPACDVGLASRVEFDPDLDRAVADADVVMALRLQSERQRGGFLRSIREYIRRWLTACSATASVGYATL